MNKSLSRMILCGVVCLGTFAVAYKMAKNFEESKHHFTNYVSGLSNTEVLKLKYYQRYGK